MLKSTRSPALVLLAVLIPLLVYLLSTAPLNPHDFLAFWGAPRALIQGVSPYNEGALGTIQQSVGYTYDHTVMFWNPPYALTFFLPFALLPFRIGQSLWFLISLAALSVSGIWLGEIFWGASAQKRAAVLWVLLFAPVLPMLFISQLAGFMLFCVVGAIRWFDSRPRLAGCLLGLAFLKPHLVVGLAIVFGARSVFERKWDFILSALMTGGCLAIPPLILRPSILYEFGASLLHPTLVGFQSPTITTLLRHYLPGPLVTSLLLCVAGSLLLWSINGSRKTSDWHVPYATAVLMTLLTTPYLWSYDFVLLLIPLFHLMSIVPGRVLTLGLVGANILLFVQRLLGFHESTFVWFVPALLAAWFAGILWNSGKLTLPRRYGSHANSVETEAG